MQNWLVVSTLLVCIAQSQQLLAEGSPPKPSIANENEDSTMRLSDAEMVVAPAGFIDSLAPYKCDADGRHLLAEA